MLLATIGHDLVTMGIPVADKVIRTVAVYAGVLVLLRIGGKRDLAQLDTFDLVVLLLLSNVVQNAVIGSDNSLLGGMLGAGVLLAFNAIVARVRRASDRAAIILEGSATVLVKDAVIQQKALAKEGLRSADVITALRRQGIDSLAEVAEARLEPNGTISVILAPGAQDATAGDIARLEAKVDRLVALVEARP